MQAVRHRLPDGLGVDMTPRLGPTTAPRWGQLLPPGVGVLTAPRWRHPLPPHKQTRCQTSSNRPSVRPTRCAGLPKPQTTFSTTLNAACARRPPNVRDRLAAMAPTRMFASLVVAGRAVLGWPRGRRGRAGDLISACNGRATLQVSGHGIRCPIGRSSAVEWIAGRCCPGFGEACGQWARDCGRRCAARRSTEPLGASCTASVAAPGRSPPDMPARAAERLLRRRRAASEGTTWCRGWLGRRQSERGGPRTGHATRMSAPNERKHR